MADHRDHRCLSERYWSGHWAARQLLLDVEVQHADIADRRSDHLYQQSDEVATG